MKKINLYVDDIRNCPEDFVVARTYDDAIRILNSNEINILSLDHDLGIQDGVERNGYDIVKYICYNNIHPNEIYIHSDNVVGRTNMYETLIGAQKRNIINRDIKIHLYPYL